MWNAMDLILLWLVAQAAVTDLALRKIPNVLVLSGLALALGLHLLMGPPWACVTSWLAGMLAGLLLFLPLYLLRAMAAGDVKLMAMVGAFVGPAAAAHIAVLAYLAGGLLALAMLWRQGHWRRLWRNLVAILQPLLGRLLGLPLVALPRHAIASVGDMPYGVAIAVATAAFVAWTHR
jgi:prepilin peptidase CpaA